MRVILSSYYLYIKLPSCAEMEASVILQDDQTQPLSFILCYNGASGERSK